MKELRANFFKGFIILTVGSLFIVATFLGVLVYLETEVYHGEVPYHIRMIAVGISVGLLMLLPFFTVRKPAIALRLEKDRRITQWGITGVRPEDQEKREVGSRESASGEVESGSDQGKGILGSGLES